MEFEILDALEDLRYDEKIDEEGLNLILKDTQQYSRILEWICNELKSVSNLEESITQVEKSEDLDAFHMELNSLLKELGCPYAQVMNGNPVERFEGEERRKTILNFLLAELQASRIDYVNNHKQLKVELSESSTARLLREMLQTLGIPKPPAGIPMKALLSKINERVTEILKKVPPKLKGTQFFVGELSPKQWQDLEQLNSEFKNEYILRREMLLKRLDVTVQSFHWSDRLKSKKDEINRIFRSKRDQLNASPSVRISDILAARSDLAIIEKTSSANVRKNTKSAVNQVVIGRVPDRGGRPNEAQPPPPEMPSWMPRQGGQTGQQGWSQGPQTQRNYGEGRGARGGSQRPKVQGGWSGHGQQQQQETTYSQPQQQAYSQPQYQQNPQYSQPQAHQGAYARGGGGGYQQQAYQQQQGGGHYQDRGGYQGQGQGNQGGYERDQGDYQRTPRDHRGGGGGGGGGYRGGGGHRGGGHRGSGRHQY